MLKRQGRLLWRACGAMQVNLPSLLLFGSPGTIADLQRPNLPPMLRADAYLPKRHRDPSHNSLHKLLSANQSPSITPEPSEPQDLPACNPEHQ